jgi:cbb3-type cytochrome oxidase subunit 3
MDWIIAPLSQWLGDLTGNMTLFIVAVIAYLLAWFLGWGLWVAMILAKAGFDDRPFLWVYTLLNLPFWLFPIVGLAMESGWLSYDMSEVLGMAYAGFLVLSLWLGIVLIAVIPWPLRKTEKPKPKKLNFDV